MHVQGLLVAITQFGRETPSGRRVFKQARAVVSFGKFYLLLK